MYIGCHTCPAVPLDLVCKYSLMIVCSSSNASKYVAIIHVWAISLILLLFGVAALLEAAKRANFKDINSRVAAGFASGRYISIRKIKYIVILYIYMSPHSEYQTLHDAFFLFSAGINRYWFPGEYQTSISRSRWLRNFRKGIQTQ